MAQNWALTRRKRRLLRVLDLLAAPLTGVYRRRRRTASAPPERILVVECWQLGDAVLALPFLRALRSRFPGAHIALLCKASTRTLLEPSGLVDEYVVADLPWTSFTGKYALRRYLDRALRSLIRRLRSGNFDVTVDARGDVRANVVTWLTGAPRRVGFGGPGSALLTDRIPGPRADTHKVEDWMAMLEPLGGPGGSPELQLDIDAAAAATVEKWKDAVGIGPRTRLVGVHPSARLAVRRWPLERFAAVISELRSDPTVRIVAFVDPDGYGAELGAQPGVLTVQPALRELPAFLAACDLFIGNDSGPAHIAAAVGTPTVTVFGPQRPEWYRPYGDGHRVVLVGDVPCRPCFDRCPLGEHVCLTRVESASVTAAARDLLARRAAAADRLAPAESYYLSRL